MSILFFYTSNFLKVLMVEFESGTWPESVEHLESHSRVPSDRGSLSRSSGDRGRQLFGWCAFFP